MQPVVNSITPLVQRSSGEEEEVQMKSGAGRVSDGSSVASGNVENQLAGSKGGGSALPDDVRSFMEPRFGADFSSVRVHTDSNAVQMNKELGAQAFAHGSDIYYGAGKSPGKDELTAHELTHTVQQGGAVRMNKKVWRKPQLEKEEKEPVQTKEIPDRPNQLNLNKELRLKLDRPPETKNIEAKQFPTQTSEITENKSQTSDFLPEKAEQKPLETKQFTSKDSARKPTPDTPKASQTAVETAPQKTPLTGGETAGTKTAPNITGVKEAAEAAPKPTVAENSPKPGAGAAAQQPPQQATPTPQNQPPNGKAPEAGAEKALGSNTKKQSDGAAAPGLSPQVAGPGAAAPAMESGAGAGDAGGEMEGGQSETDPDIEAAAASNEKVELDPSESDAAMASLAGGGGAEAPTGGGGGGGGAAITEKPAPPIPNVSGAEPSAALASVSNLPPAQLLAGLGSVGSAVGNTVAKERAELAANPPQMESPSASPTTGEKSAADKNLPPGKTPKAVEKNPEGQAKPIPQPKSVPLPPPAAAAVRPPQVKGDEQGKVSSGDIKNLQGSLNAIPTRDPGLQNVSVGTPPQLELQGNADPQRALEQKAKLEKGLTQAHSQGQQDLAQPAGEQEIYPKVPKETLRAEGIGGGGAGGAVAVGRGAASGVAGDEAISMIAQQQQGQQIQAAVAQAQAQMAAKRQEHTAQVAQEKAKSNKEIAKLQQHNAVEQEAQRAKARTDIGQQRSQWQKEQDTLIKKSRQDADAAISKVGKEVSQEQIKGQSKAAEHIKEGEEKAAIERRKGEEKAAAERQKGEEQSGGIFGWLADKAKAFFEGIKQAINAAMEAARAAVKFVIEGAQKLATAALEAARQVIVGMIKLASEALIAIGEVMLAAFPEMRERYRNAMKAIVRTAENAVNAIANNLKKGVQVALNLLGKGLDFALGLMEKGLMAAVEIASIAVQGAISTAKAAVDALGAFAVLAKDIAPSPGQWLSNLGAGAQDGVRNHLWGAFQTATQEWFNQKVEEVLGLGTTVWKVLNQGGIKTAEVGKMAWDGIKSAIPPALIQILIEKVISMIVPAAGAVLVIIEGLQAAWGTVSRVIQAFDRFMGFLKAVKTGQSGPQFGAALAAAGVVLIDFVSNWLLKRVRGAASKVAAKVKEIAKKIGRKLKATTKKLGGKFGKVKDKFKGKEKGNKGSKDQNKDKKKDQDKELRPIAQRAAQQGWKKVQGLTRKQIQPESVVNSQLSQTPARKSGVSIQTTLLTQGSTWMVESVATKEGKSAKASAGRGWIAKDAGGKKYYAGIDNSSLHKQILKETAAKLNQPDTGDMEGNGNLQSAYERKVHLAKQLEQEGQQKIDNRIKGIKFSVNLEAFEGVKTDKKIATKMTISPNVEELKTNIVLKDKDSNFNDLAQAITRSTGLKKTYKVIDEIGRFVDAIVERVNAKRTDAGVVKIAPPELHLLNNQPLPQGIGVISHQFMFKLETSTGTPAFLQVERVSGNDNCASCELPQNPAVTTPHNVVTAAHARAALEAALKSLGLFDPASDLYIHMEGIAASTSKGAALPTTGIYQKQCLPCEGNASGDRDGTYLAAQSLMQRAAGATAPSGATAASRGMDKQFQTTTPTARKDITSKRIGNLISILDFELQNANKASNPASIIDVLLTNPAKRAEFLRLLRKSLWNLVK